MENEAVEQYMNRVVELLGAAAAEHRPQLEKLRSRLLSWAGLQQHPATPAQLLQEFGPPEEAAAKLQAAPPAPKANKKRKISIGISIAVICLLVGGMAVALVLMVLLLMGNNTASASSSARAAVSVAQSLPFLQM